LISLFLNRSGNIALPGPAFNYAACCRRRALTAIFTHTSDQPNTVQVLIVPHAATLVMFQCNLLLCASIAVWTCTTALQQHVTYKAAVGLLFTHEQHLTLRASGHFQLNFLLSLPPLQEMAQEVYQEENVNIE
jgi:hypothetical protein